MPNTTTVEWQGVTFTLVDTAWRDVIFARMLDKFVPKEAPDRGLASDVCYVLAHVETMDGADGWKLIDDTSKPDRFAAAYKGLLNLGTRDDFSLLVDAVIALKAPKAGAQDKPDEALTPDEADDPN